MARPARDILREAASRLAEAGIDRPAQEARWIAAHVAGCAPGAAVFAALDEGAVMALVARRAAREPLAYILGEAPFGPLSLAVSPATLIPRADTETLIEAARAAFPDPATVRRVLDLGTGTGALLLAALDAFSQAFGIGVDIVPAAASLAAENAARTGLADRAALVCGAWSDPIAGAFDLVLANPPYIPSAEIAGLMPEVRLHEPASALDGGADGLDAYRVLISGQRRLLGEGGVAIYELGAGQAEAVASLAAQAGFTADFRSDPGGHPRAIVLTAPTTGAPKMGVGGQERCG